LDRQPIGTDWSVLIDREFNRKADGGDIVFWKADRSVYASVFKTIESDAERAIERMIEGRPGIPVQIFDRDERGLRGHAYLLPEVLQGHKYWGLNTWTAADGQVACVTIYFDNFNDLNWAIQLWKSVRPQQRAHATN
jgi:hypothetical protein